MLISIVRAALVLFLLGFSATGFAAAPAASTQPASGITSSSVVLNGVGLPNGQATTGYFRYSATDPGSCSDTFGTRVPTAGGTDLGSGTTSVPYSITATGLTQGVTYYFCAIVTNAADTALGSIQSFTIPYKPVVVTVGSTNVTSSSATLQATANPVAAATTAWFRYSSSNPGICDDSFGTRTPSSGGTNLGSGITPVAYTQNIASLLPGVTYYFCAIANNSYGTTFGTIQSFTAPAMAPTVTTGGASNLTRTTGQLSGYANPGGDATKAWFRLGTASPGTCNDTFGRRTPTTGGITLGAGTSNAPFSQNIATLTQGTTYYYCALASNSLGTSWGSVQSFITPSPPTATTVSVSAASITNTSATINGVGNPNRAASTGWFRYAPSDPSACDDKFGSRAPVSGGISLGSDAYDQAYSVNLTGLSPATTYYYCAIVSSSEGVAYGALKTFTTASPPLAATVAASSVGSTSATMNGLGTANGASASAWFRYSSSDPGTCNDSFGWRLPSSSSINIGSAASAVPFSQSVSSLQPGTTYYYCAIVYNGYGTSFGELLTFTTAAMAPTVNTGGTSSVTRSTATLNAYGNPGGDATIGWFRYSTISPGSCNDSFGTRAPAMAGSALGAGSGSIGFAQTVTGLSPATTYYYCALASNSSGTVFGSVQSFITPSTPTATTVAATNITTSSATINGLGNPNRASAIGWFRYSSTDPGTCDDKFGSRVPLTSGTSLGSDIYDQSFAQNITGLSGGATYYYCAIVSSSEGIAYGRILSFTTSGIPAAVSNAATSISANSAVLNGAGGPNGASASGWFRYSTVNPGTCSDSFGTRAPSSTSSSLGSGTASVPYSQSIGSLQPGTTYYFCAIVSNTYGTGFGSVLSFSTPAMAPTVTTGSPTVLTMSTGTLSGYGSPGGDATTAWFRYSTASPGTCNDSFGTRAPAMGGSALGAGASNVPFSQAITGLTPATTYYYCALASNSIGSAVGTVQTFVTPSAPIAITSAVSNLADSSATLNGIGTPNRASATGWFRYSTTNPGACDDKFGSRAPTSGGVALGSDIYGQSYAQSITGLSPATTYYYCAVVSSSEGTAFGSLLSFTTATSPTATTLAVSGVTSGSATLRGEGTPNGASASAWFRYSTSNPGTCNDSFGWRAPTSSSTSIGSGASAVAYATSIASLQPGSTYYYCAIVSNSYGTGFGAVLSFTTPPTAPTVVTGGASSLTMSSGVLSGYGNPGGDATTAWFRYSLASPGTCNDSFGTRAPAMGGSALGAGPNNVAFSQAVTGLAPATTYYYCALATNSSGTAFGSVQTFVTPAAPTAFTTAASNLTNTSATLNGYGNPNRASASGWFRYSTTNPVTCDDKFGSRTPLSGGVSIGSDIYDQSFSQSISGLSPATTYYFCAIVASTEGTAYGAVLSFTTASPSAATTVAAVSISSYAATLRGEGTPNGASASGWFRYSTVSPGVCNDSFGSRIPSSSSTSLGAGMTSVPYSQSVSSLLPGTTYYYCAIVGNSYGTGFGAILSFTTPVTSASVVTTGASSLTMTTGVLSGYANPGGDATTGWFRFSTASPGTCNDTFGTRAPTMGGSALGAGNSNVVFSQPITGLSPATTYYYCAIAANSSGTVWGSVQTFITPSPPTVVTTPANSITTNSATLNGAGNPNRASANGWFRYATTNPGSCDDKFGSRAPVTGGVALGNDVYDQSFSQNITGLSPATTYYYCAIVASTEGTAFGALLSFTTSAPATATTTTPASVAPTTATLTGTGNPNGAAATGWFRYSTVNPGTCNDSFGTRTPTSGGTSLGSAMSPVAFGQPITGLQPGLTYYYCAIVSNSYGVGLGAVLSFTTPPGPPSVTTDSASGIVTNLYGSANPNGATATGWFRIATSSPGTCNDTFGTRVPTTGGAALGAGSSVVAYSQPAPTLVPGTTYYYCAIASNSVGSSFGAIRSFTAPMAPTVATMAATPVTATTATLNGSSNPNGNSTIGWFRYSTSSPGTCNDVFGTRAPSASGTSLGSGSSSTPFAESISGLSPSTTYYFCAIALSAYGTAYGSVLSFTTPPASSFTKPSSGGGSAIVAQDSKVSTLAASEIVAESAILHGSATPRGVEMSGWFRYSTTAPKGCSDTFGIRAPHNGATALGAGDKPVEFSQALTGLQPGTTYYYCAIGSGSDGTSFGEILSLTTTPSSPVATTSPPSDVAAVSATLSAVVVPRGDATTAWFRYDTVKPETCNDSFGQRAPVDGSQSVGSGSRPVLITEPIAGLVRGETYYYCVIAQNTYGQAVGAIERFIPGTEAPHVVTEDPASIDAQAATVAATVYENGSTAAVWFRVGDTEPSVCDESFGTRVTAQRGASGGQVLGPDGQSQAGSAGYLSDVISGLRPSTTYFYCAVASNMGGVKFGQVRSFTTLAPPPELGTVTTKVEPVDSSTGCSYTERRGDANPLAVLLLLPLALVPLVRRRRAA